MIKGSSVLERTKLKKEIKGMITDLGNQLSNIVRNDKFDDKTCRLSYVQVLSISLESGVESVYVSGSVKYEIKDEITRNFNLLTGSVEMDYEAINIFSKIMFRLNRGYTFNECVEENVVVHDVLLMHSFCEKLNSLAGTLINSAQNNSCIKETTVTAANLLADRLYKISTETVSKGYFDKKTMDLSDENSIFRAATAIYRDTDRFEIIEDCEDLKTVINEIRGKIERESANNAN